LGDQIATNKVMDLTMFTHPPVIVGECPAGRRINGYLKGGHFKGVDKLQGEVLPFGGDWLLIRADGGRALDVRATLKCNDGGVINLAYGGRWLAEPGHADRVFDRERSHLADPTTYSIRVAMTAETGASNLAWLNDALLIGLGRRIEGGVKYAVHQVLDRYLGA
jgi:hypothetical protein